MKKLFKFNKINFAYMTKDALNPEASGQNDEECDARDDAMK